MTDFFKMLGKAFAVVFGGTSALALTLILFALAARPVLKSWVREASMNTRTEWPSVASHEAPPSTAPQYSDLPPGAKVLHHPARVLHLCMEFDEKGQCADPAANEWNLSLGDCSKDGCFVYSGNVGVGYLSRNEVTKAYRAVFVAGGGKEFYYDSQGNRIK